MLENILGEYYDPSYEPTNYSGMTQEEIFAGFHEAFGHLEEWNADEAWRVAKWIVDDVARHDAARLLGRKGGAATSEAKAAAAEPDGDDDDAPAIDPAKVNVYWKHIEEE